MNVLVKAIKRGTLTHAKGNFHFDPEGFPSAKQRPVPADVAALARAKGLVEILRTTVQVEGADGQTIDDRAAERGAEQRTRLNDRDATLADVLGGTAAGDTMATTHTMRDRTMTANDGESIKEIGTGEAGDEEAGDDTVDDMSTSSSDDAPPADSGPQAGSSRARRAAARAAKPPASTD